MGAASIQTPFGCVFFIRQERRLRPISDSFAPVGGMRACESPACTGRPAAGRCPGEAATAAGAEQGSRLAVELGLLPAVGRALWARGLREAEEAARFLQPQLEHLPDPFALKGIEAAVARLSRALEAREPICVYG